MHVLVSGDGRERERGEGTWTGVGTACGKGWVGIEAVVVEELQKGWYNKVWDGRKDK